MLFFVSIGMTVLANLFYHLAMKMTDERVNPVLSLILTYLTAATTCAVLYPFFKKEAFSKDIALLGWPTLLLGFSICFLELGFLLAYRAGWKLSTAALTCNVAVGLLLLPVGIFAFREELTSRHVAGLLFAMVGLVLLFRR